jgi:hypothetical protein
MQVRVDALAWIGDRRRPMTRCPLQISRCGQMSRSPLGATRKKMPPNFIIS